jgi:hypothetical protein
LFNEYTYVKKVFFGTPHRGSKLADWAVLGSKIAGAAFLKPPKTYLKALRSNSEALRAISEDFVPLSEKYHITSFWEEDMMPTIQDVVCWF